MKSRHHIWYFHLIIQKSALIKQGIIETYDYRVSYNYEHGHNIASE